MHSALSVSARELVSQEGVPRELRCRGLSLSRLAKDQGMTLKGDDGEVAFFKPLSKLAGLDDEIEVTYLSSSKFADSLKNGSNVAVITRAELRGSLKEGNVALIVDGDPHDCFYTALAWAVENGNYERLEHSISPSAKVHSSAVIGDAVHIEEGAVVGPNAVVLDNTYIGSNVVIKANATVGGDGFENALIRGRRSIVPHAGGVWLSEGVQVGSSTCVDRGLFGDFSFAGPYTTIDNLVHFAHSARTGRNCSLVACSEISGSVVLGNGVWLGPNVSVNQSLSIGDHCYVGTAAVVTRDLPPHSLAYGSPAKVAAQVCVCRAKLRFESGAASCALCGRNYKLDSSGQVRSV
jgi:UDP-3-O-[3-hydroxymyristoyl] glucosamine N-acyltransferase